MYVNELTQDYGDEGRKAVTELLRRGEALGAFPHPSRSTSSRRARTATPYISLMRAVVLSAVRTPIGRYAGALSGVRPGRSGGHRDRRGGRARGRRPGEIEDVYFGCANQAGEDNRNVARMAALLAGLPESVAGVTVNRLCASGLSAVVSACHAVMAGDAEIVVAGGVESMSRAPFVMAKAGRAFPRGDRTIWDTTLGWRFPNPRLEGLFPLESMGETGENVAERWGVSREDQDAFALALAGALAAATAGGAIRRRTRPGR